LIYRRLQLGMAIAFPIDEGFCVMKRCAYLFLAIQVVLWTLPAARAEAFRKERGRQRESRPRAEAQMDRLKRIMTPLLRAANQPLEQVHISIVDESAINAGSAGNGQFFVTTGLLSRASDDQLRGVLAHEIAHEDLGHPMKAQVLGTGLELGTSLLEQIMPGSGAVAPVAGTLISGHYSRPMELAADRHAVKILQRAGYGKSTMINALDWLVRLQGDTGGGLFASHPATSERIQALQKLR
jgi:predicted Zn-dependent protease